MADQFCLNDDGSTRPGAHKKEIVKETYAEFYVKMCRQFVVNLKCIMYERSPDHLCLCHSSKCYFINDDKIDCPIKPAKGSTRLRTPESKSAMERNV